MSRDRGIDAFRLQGESAFDWGLFLTVVLLIAAGLLSIYSATYGSSMSSNFTKQMIAVGIGTVVMFVTMYLPERLLRLSSYPFYAFSTILLVAVLFIGHEVFGTKGWIRMGGFNLQPSELAKLGTLMALANYLSRKGTDIRTLRDLGITFVMTAFPIYLILKQPDVGSASVLAIMYLGVLFWVGFDSFILYFIFVMPVIIIMSLIGTFWMVTGIVLFSVIAFLFRKRIWMTAIAIVIFIISGIGAPQVYENLYPHQKKRIDSFLNPGSDPLGAGYNVMQSKMAVGSGGLSGKGYLKGTQTQLRWVPMQWTDFIFSVPAEEFGFIGSILIVGLFIYLLIRSLSIAYEAEDKYTSIISAGAVSMLIYHILINIGMVIGVMPVMGIPLPFMSYGGTSMIFNMLLIGLLLNSYRSKRTSKKL